MKLKQTHVSLTTVASIAQQAATKKLDHGAVTQDREDHGHDANDADGYLISS